MLRVLELIAGKRSQRASREAEQEKESPAASGTSSDAGRVLQGEFPGEPWRGLELMGDDADGRIEIVFDANIRAAPPILERAMAFARKTEAVSSREGEVSEALREAVFGAILHGCREDASKRVRLRLARDAKGALMASIRCPGLGFDQWEAGKAADRGGLASIRASADQMRFEDNGRELHLRFDPPQSEGTEPTEEPAS